MKHFHAFFFIEFSDFFTSKRSAYLSCFAPANFCSKQFACYRLSPATSKLEKLWEHRDSNLGRLGGKLFCLT